MQAWPPVFEYTWVSTMNTRIGLPLMMEPATPDAFLPELTALYIAEAVLTNIFNFMAIIVFATMLSLFYREHVVFQASVGQAAYAPL